MKLIPLFLLLSIVSCGNKKTDDKKSAEMDKVLAPSACVVSSLTPVIKVPRPLIDKILVDFQGRPFNRNAFWNIISRQTRLDVNLFLNENLKAPEEVLFPGFVLYMENLFENPGEGFYLRTSKHHIKFDGEEIKSPCGFQDDVLSQIDTKRLIPASTEELVMNCRVDSLLSSHSFSLRFFKKHLIMKAGEELFLFSGAEIIRKEDSSGIKIDALDPDQRTLSLRMDQNEDGENKRRVAVHFFGKTTYFDGTGTCLTLRK